MTEPLEKLTDRVNDISQGLVVVENNVKHHDDRFKKIEEDIELIADQIIEINKGNIELQASGRAVIKVLSILFAIVTTLAGISISWIATQVQ